MAKVVVADVSDSSSRRGVDVEAGVLRRVGGCGQR